MERYDIRVEKAYINANNDVELFWSDSQHVKDIINANVGAFKENPNIGVGINQYLLGSGIESEVARKCIIQLQGDNYHCNRPKVEFVGQKLTIDPNIEL